MEPTLGEWPTLVVSLLVGGAVAAIFGVIIGLPALRLAAVPVVSSGDVLGSVLIASDDTRLPLTETELSILKTAALYLGKQLE